MSPSLPILYSFRRCPYAIRARMALKYANLAIELREVVLKDKPAEMLALSPKGTVPVLLTKDQRVIDESLDIMHWAIAHNDPSNLIPKGMEQRISELIQKNDIEFKPCLDKYKYADRHPEKSELDYRQDCEVLLNDLERLLKQQAFLCGEAVSLADIAIFPFVRQFAFVDKDWFDSAPYPKLQHWLNHFLGAELFTRVMPKHSQWDAGKETVYL